MSTYITLISLTEKGITEVKEGPARLDEAKKAFKAMGAELKEFFLVSGQYDMVVIVEAPDDMTVAKLALLIGSQGAIRTQTMMAFTEEEYRKVVADLP
jgi:uncharacterized protein with GYD domain